MRRDGMRDNLITILLRLKDFISNSSRQSIHPSIKASERASELIETRRVVARLVRVFQTIKNQRSAWPIIRVFLINQRQVRIMVDDYESFEKSTESCGAVQASSLE